MTLTRRVTFMVVGWIVVILAVFNVIFLARAQTQAYTALRSALQLELDDVWRLNRQVPHLAVSNTGWEDAILVVPSAVKFYDRQGRVTSSGFTEGFPESSYKQAWALWRTTVLNDIQKFELTASTFPPNQNMHGDVPQPFTQSSPQTPTSPEVDLPVTDATDRTSTRFIGVEQAFLYPDGAAGAIVVAATTKSVADAMAGAIEGLLWTDVPVILIVSLGTYLVTVGGLRHIHQLIEAIRGLQWSAISRIHMESAPVEIETLALTINQLLDKVDNGVQEQRRFIADASHELRTPLAIIAGHANLLRRWGGTKPEVWEPAVHHIDREVRRLQSLVDNLLALARIDHGNEEQVHGISGDELSYLLVQLKQDGEVLRPDLEWVVQSDVPEVVWIHFPEHALRQVLVAFMDNAMKHSQSGQRIVLKAVAMVDEVRVSVVDHGEGIPEEDIPFIFDRFYRGKRVVNRTQPGSGLGLAIAKELIEAFGSTVSVESEIGQGTTVNVHLLMENQWLASAGDKSTSMDS